MLDPSSLTRAEALSLLGWWIEAGVDTPVQEECRDWRQATAPEAPAPPLGERPARVEATPPAVPAGRTLPTSLEAWREWLATSADLPLFRSGAARALPHGPAGAELMVIAGAPTPEDAAEGRPIGGAAWELAQRMLRAAGPGPDGAYVTATTCFSPIGTRFSPADASACRDSLRHEIALVAPRRLLLLGDGPSKLLLDQPMASARGKLHRIAGLPAAVTFSPRQLLASPDLKRLAWADLLLIMGA